MGNMSKQTIKTTIEIEADLLYLAKRKALDENSSLKNVVNESLKLNLTQKQHKQKTIKIGGHHLGKVKTNISRDEIYDNY